MIYQFEIFLINMCITPFSSPFRILIPSADRKINNRLPALMLAVALGLMSERNEVKKARNGKTQCNKGG